MGVGSRTKAWRFTDINKDYSVSGPRVRLRLRRSIDSLSLQFCPTYPARMVVPTRISDATLQYASKYRSKCRIPALAYLHWANYVSARLPVSFSGFCYSSSGSQGSITRSSQPMVGITLNRSIQDEKLIEAIFQSHHSPDSRATSGPVYGATATNLIIDARPTTNAMANVAKGAGTENMEYYKDGKKAYLGVDNIHVMRDSLNKVVEALREADTLAYSIGGDDASRASSLSAALLDRNALRRSGWLRHISALLDGALLIVRNVHVNSSHVLIHCSDGWDRTSQLSSLAQLCLDPFYRTVRGFQILVEKDWLSFGHRFLDRCGHLSSDKFFLSPSDAQGGGAEAAQAFLASVQNRLGGQHHLKETSPVFHQFLECVRQIQRQYPERFEFNGRFLEQIHYHLYSCQFGSFLFNCERERRQGDGGSPPPCDRTVSVWDFLNSPSETELNLNPLYDPSLDDPDRREGAVDMGVLFPNPKDVRFWSELYGRTDEEMNGKVVTADAQGADFIGPVDGTDDDSISASVKALHVPHSSSPARSMSSTPTLPTSPPAGEFLQDDKGSLGISPPNLSSSMPELSPKPGLERQDSFRPFASTTSAFTLRPNGGNSNMSPAGSIPTRVSPSPIRVRPKQNELFPGAMKSVWGKLSTNASAAFTAVQGAYDGVSKEFKGMNLGQGWENQRSMGGELQSQDRSRVLGDESDWRSSQTQTASTSERDSQAAAFWSTDNPSERWRSEGAQPKLSSLTLDNPWGTSRNPGRRSPKRAADEVFATPAVWADEGQRPSSTPLPVDPTILPTPSSSSPSSSQARPIPADFIASSQGAAVGARLLRSPSDAKSSPVIPATSPPSLDTSSDPLGVGVL